MITLSQYITNHNNKLKLSKEDKLRLLHLDNEYGKLCEEFWTEWDRTDCKNLDEEFEKFISARKNGKKYFPQLELVKDNLTEDWLVRANRLKTKFLSFNCFLSKYYIENLDHLYKQVNMTVHKDDKQILSEYNRVMCLPISDKDYKFAWKLLKQYPYEDKREVQPYRGKGVISMMKSHMDKRGYGFDVILNPYMIARQNVEPHNKTLHIKTDGYFSDLDVESLRIHEIDVHVAKRYYGFKTGLNLFAYGLQYSNTLDEGSAINQSLHHNKFGVKPNLQFDIALKAIIGRHIMEKDFCELYDFLIDKITTEQNKNIIELILFKNLCRFKRVLNDCSKMGGASHEETDYLCGYQMIKRMSEKRRDDIIKYNIGPSHIKDLSQIKKFLSTNKFDSLI